MKSLILLAEDNEATLDMTKTQLEFLGYQVTLARNGVEAVARAIAELPDLIVMDVHMQTESNTLTDAKTLFEQRKVSL